MDQVKRNLMIQAGGLCSLCREDLNEKKSDDGFIGETAHIIARKDNGPRGDSSYPKENREDYENLILLCPNCHTKIDKLPEEYPVEFLKRKKGEHEKWVTEKLGKNISQINFAELDIAARAIATQDYPSESDFLTTPIQEKIDKNELSQSVINCIKIGISRSAEVNEYLKQQGKLDPAFPHRLSQGFQKKYKELKQETDSGDDLFCKLVIFMNSILIGEKERVAGLVILCHLFEICEVFEK